MIATTEPVKDFGFCFLNGHVYLSFVSRANGGSRIANFGNRTTLNRNDSLTQDRSKGDNFLIVAFCNFAVWEIGTLLAFSFFVSEDNFPNSVFVAG